ncbi:FliH/SctL family protein [Vibrio sp. MEBiC08052]|uniref:FliH/SctL family protein n=1 Tax=Vibrio sp. MEBiC08052 TaxID=1761910 RepID=UPI00074072C7|nr:FliH/SctL family protein [Vibrio sp. MEBiC08052]KUI97018.1 hypothetical protein VRK_38730 [Vibrio sp. MEBiC08052]
MGKIVEPHIWQTAPSDTYPTADKHARHTASHDQEQLRMAIQTALEAEYAAREQQLKEQWIAEGYQAGVRDTQTELKDQTIVRLNERRARLEQVVDILEQSVASIHQEQQRVVERVKSELIDVVFAAVCQIISKDFLENTQRIECVLRPLLDEYQHEQHLEFQLSPADFALLKQQTSLIAQHPAVRFSEAPSLEAGGVILKSRHGRLDLRLSTKLEQLMQVLMKHGESC